MTKEEIEAILKKCREFTGISEEFHQGGNPKTWSEITQGRRHGIFRRWNTRGIMIVQTSFVFGKQHGISENRNGYLSQIPFGARTILEQYKDSFKNGVYIMFKKYK